MFGRSRSLGTACLLALAISTEARAQGELPTIFDALARMSCSYRGPHAPLREAASFYTLIELHPKGQRAGIRNAVDSIAQFWDGPLGCATVSADSLASWRARADSVELFTVRASLIQGPGELRWGQQDSQVIGLLGQPYSRERDSVFGTERLVWPKKRVLGEDATQVVVIDDRVGLIQSGYVVTPSSRERCDAIYRESVSAMKMKFPAAVQMTEATTNSSVTGLGLCEAVGIERASALTFWRDSTSRVQAAVSIIDERQIIISYYTGVSRRLIEAKSFLDKRNTF